MELSECGTKICIYPGNNSEGAVLLLEAVFLVSFQAPQAFPPGHYFFDLWFPFPESIRTALPDDGEKRSAIKVRSVCKAGSIEFLKSDDVIF
jgi:hypothetical protein